MVVAVHTCLVSSRFFQGCSYITILSIVAIQGQGRDLYYTTLSSIYVIYIHLSIASSKTPNQYVTKLPQLAADGSKHFDATTIRMHSTMD